MNRQSFPWCLRAQARRQGGFFCRGLAPLVLVVVLALLALLPGGRAWAHDADLGSMGLSQAQTVCRDVNTHPWLSGVALAQPGRWWNPKRYGTGWDLVYSDDRKSLKAFFYTYNANGHPVWLATKMTAIDNSGDFWRANLLEYTMSTGGEIDTGTDVGDVYFRFFRDDPSRIAMRWHWDAVPAGGAAYFEECLSDLTRLNPTYYTGAQAPQTVELAAPEATAPGLNQTFSGYWSDLTDVDKVPGVVMTIMQTSLGEQVGHFGEAAVWLSFNQLAEGGRKRPVFLQAQRVNLRAWLPFETDAFDLYFHYAIGYPNGFPTTDCVYNGPTGPGDTNPCVSNHRIGSYERTFRFSNNYRKADVKYTLDPAALTSEGTVANPRPPRSSVKLIPSGQMTINRMTRLQDISVNRYVCTPAAPAFPGDQPTCDVQVSWSGNQIGKPWKRDLGTLSYDPAPLSLEDIGVAAVALRTGDRFQFELWSGTPGAPGAQLLDRAPEVRGVSVHSASTGAIPLPDASLISNAEDLPVHDATVGAVAGSADVSGGAATYTVPIQVPPGRNGMQPAVSLNYSSRAGNGVAGLGWSLSAGSSLHRCPQTLAQDGALRGVRLDGADRLCLDGQRLMRAPGSSASYGLASAEYRTEIDSFARITQSGAALNAGGVCFTVLQKDGRKLSYGCAPAAQPGCAAGSVAPRVQPSGQSVELSWLLSRVEDPQGNTLDYCYGAGEQGSEVLLRRIVYTGSTQAGLPAPNRRVDFRYEARPTDWRGNDRSSSWIAGGGVEQTQRLTEIATYSPDSPDPARLYRLQYTDVGVTELPYSYTSGRSLLRGIEECGYAQGVRTCLKPTVFTWSDGTWLFESRKLVVSPLGTQQSAPVTPPPPGQEVRYTPDYRRNRVEAIGDLDGDGAREWWIVKTWYDAASRDQPWRTQVQIAKVTADRTLQGVLTLTEMPPFARAADFDGDGVSELLAESYLYKWKRGRGAPLCDGAAATCTATASSYFDRIPSNLPAGTQDFIEGIADFNGDGAPDVLMRTGLLDPCPVNDNPPDPGEGTLPTGCAPLYAYLNPRPGVLVAGSSLSFVRSPLLGTLSANGGLAESIQHLTDFNGDGFTDLVIGNAAGLRRLLLVSPSGTTLSAAQVTPGSVGFPADTRQMRWLDVNGDGLDDVLTVSLPAGAGNCQATSCFGFWQLRLNRGGQLGPMAELSGATTAGLRYDGMDGTPQLRYFSKLLSSDIDTDGRGDLLYPARFAARLCFGAYLPHNRFLAPRPAKDCPLVAGRGATCEADVCAAPPPEDGSTWDAHPSSAQIDAADAFTSGLGAFDPSVYRFNAIRFVQTGTNAFRLQVDETPVIAATSVLGNQAGRIDDYFGDGLADVVSDVTCPLRPTKLFDTNTCSLAAGGRAGPGAADGSSFLDSQQTVRMSDLVSPANINLLINENQGDGARPGLAPVLPDLMVRAVNALNERAQWDYFPLSSSAGRSGSDFPLYQIDTGYVDTRHFLFQSSMPVVGLLARSHAASGGTSGLSLFGTRSLRYAYGGAMYHSEGRGFQGFRTIATETLGTPERTLRTITTFHQKFPLTGRIESIETRVPQVSGANGRLSLETQTWGCNRANRAQPC
ncbi:MAG: VCBS repeat-containing protein, partial [Rhodanobacteraceae bacterium]|nr:VCBS repeat-containing protein [Rhodanobacteraceae bacterium]